METMVENLIVYGSVILLCLIVVLIYLRKLKQGFKKGGG